VGVIVADERFRRLGRSARSGVKAGEMGGMTQVASMGWHWRYETSSGEVIEDLPQVALVTGFPNQGEAESWLGESWRDLLQAGIDQVSLLEGERVVYGPMSLHAQ